jgi:hypothetical protein
VTTSPEGLSGISITYTQNGVPVAGPTHAGQYTVVATLNNPDYTAPAVTGTLVIGQAMPSISWSAPTSITVGTPLGAAQLDALASFNGAPVPGVLTYAPAAGTVLPIGSGQILMVTFTPTDLNDFRAATSSVSINVVPVPIPPRAMIIGEQPVFQRRLNKKGKPVGAAVLTGFTLKFNMPLSAAAVSNRGNYQLDNVTTRKVKKSVQRILRSIANFTVKYTPASDSVTLSLVGSQTFPTGGQLTVSSAVTSNSGAVLVAPSVFKISAGGKSISPQG